MSEWAHSSVDHAQWRQALPAGFAHRPDLQAELQQRFARLFAQLSAELEPAQLSERLTRRVRSSQSVPFEFHADGGVIAASTGLRMAPQYSLSLIHEGDSVSLQFGARRVRLQAATAPALAAVAAGGAFTAQSLPAGISLEARLSLVRYLQGLGLVRLEPGESQADPAPR